MSFSYWTVDRSLPYPVIEATIGNGTLWTLTTNTTIDANLPLCHGCWLLLSCISVYSVTWYDAQKKEATQNTTVAHTASRAEFSHPSTIFRSSMYFSGNDLGTCSFSCGNTSIPEKTMIRIEIIVKPNDSDANTNRTTIVQSGFTPIRFRDNYVVKSTAADITVAFIYSIHPDAKLYQYFVDPFNNTHEIPSSKKHYFTAATDRMSCRFGRTALQFSPPDYYYSEYTSAGEYTFIMDTTMNNGTIYRITQTFEVIIPEVVEESPLVSEGSARGYAVVVLDLNHHYRMQITSYYEEDLTLTSTSLLSAQATRCSSIEAEAPIDTCGVVEVSRFKQPSWFASQAANHVTIETILEARKPCHLRITVMTEQYNFSRTADLFFSVANPAIFRYSNVPLIISKPQGILRGESGMLRTENLFIGDALTLTCLIPACQVDIQLDWCHRNETGEYQSCTSFQYDNKALITTGEIELDIEFGIRYLDGTTMAFEKVFTDLSARHIGIHSCISTKINYSLGAYSPPPSVTRGSSVYLNPQIPVPPSFAANVSDSTSILIRSGESFVLNCPSLNSNPTAILTWKWNGNIISNRELTVIPRLVDLENTSIEIDRPGEYVCNASNRFGEAEHTFTVSVDFLELALEISIPLVCILLSLAIFLVWWMKRRNLKRLLKQLAKDLRHSDGVHLIDGTYLNDQIDNLPYEDHLYEIERDRFELKDQIGKGEFGRVWKGALRLDTNIDVAVKVPADKTNGKHFSMLVSELKLMIHLSPHVNVLGVIGACTSKLEQQELFIITDFCELGSLQDYMIQHRQDFEDSSMQSVQLYSHEMLLSYAYQAANGMEHLAGQNLIHRDIALRNLLLTGDHVVKVADFGLSRLAPSSVYKKDQTKRDDKMPLYWMAIESIMSGEYTQKSDVWSFGVLLWELFSCGRPPYPDYNIDKRREFSLFVEWLQSNQRLCPTRLTHSHEYSLMRRCWDSDPKDRPDFQQCRKELQDRLTSATSADVHVRLANAWSVQCAMFRQRRKNIRNLHESTQNIAAIQSVDEGTNRGLEESTSIELYGIASAESVGTLPHAIAMDLESIGAAQDIVSSAVDVLSSGVSGRTGTTDNSEKTCIEVPNAYV